MCKITFDFDNFVLSSDLYPRPPKTISAEANGTWPKPAEKKEIHPNKHTTGDSGFHVTRQQNAA